jgi:hypothetical protein
MSERVKTLWQGWRKGVWAGFCTLLSLTAEGRGRAR